MMYLTVGCTSDGGPPPSDTSIADSSDSLQSSSSFQEHPPLTGAAASSVAADLGSGDQARVTSQLVLPTDVTLDPSVYTQLQALNPINVEDASFKQLSDTEAQVYAKVGADQKDWTLLLIWQNDRWQLGDTLEGKVDTTQLTSSGDASAVTTPVSGTTG
jgi:hypothetical protein